MAGPAITKVLESRDYERFHWLVHDYSENVLGPLTSIDIVAGLFQRLADMRPIPRPMDEPEAAATILQAASAIRNLRLGSKTREFFWPGFPGDSIGYYHAANRKRWAPYDGEAWDRFFGEFVDFMVPLLAECLALGEQIAARVLTESSEEPLAENERTLRKLPEELMQHCNRLKTLLDPDTYESMVSDWLKRQT
jgi:hypothetical protein